MAAQMLLVNAFAPIKALADRLFERSLQDRHEDLFASARVLVLGFDARDLLSLNRCLQDLGVVTRDTTSDTSQLEHIVTIQSRYSVIVINAEAFDDLGSAIDTLLPFRRQTAGLGVVLISSRVLRDDFGPERRAICDATLRSPITAHRLRQGIEAALEHSSRKHP